MPDQPAPKVVPHPWRASGTVRREERLLRLGARAESMDGAAYAELHVTSNFTFLTGGSHPEEVVERAGELGLHAVAIADVNSLAGIVRGHVAAKEAGVPFVVGCRLVFASEGDALDENAPAHASLTPPLLVHPTDRASYGRLCTLLTIGRRRAPKGECWLSLPDFLAYREGLLVTILPPTCDGANAEGHGDVELLGASFEAFVAELREAIGDDALSLGAHALFGPDDARWLARLDAIGRAHGVPLVALNDVHYHVPERRALQDVLACIREHCTLDEAGFVLFPNGERYLKSPAEMARLFANYPEAIARTVTLAERALSFSLDELKYEYPDEVSPFGASPMQYLVELTWKGARERYPPQHFPDGIPAKVRRLLEHEFALIDELGYAPYFLTVFDIVQFAREQGILCQGRGAAANSAVCYCLGITAVDPDRIDILFERFVSKERDEPPDIDVDFEHERREEVIQYIYAKYGRERAALTAVVISYRGRSAIRDVGKVLGLSVDAIDRLAKDMDWWHEDIGVDRLRALGLDPADPSMKRFLVLLNAILGFPRHLSQHVGGFVVTRGPLCELVPIENAAMEDRTVIEWDKDDIDAMGMLKIDVLALGILTCTRKALDLINHHALELDPQAEPLELHTIPPEDPRVYDMLCEADSVGVFQIESRAQMSMLPRLKPRTFYDLVIEVAIVRPGPIQGKMVHPYLRRRSGEEAVTYPSDEVRHVLEKTLGVPLFQEQAMALSVVAAGFTPGQADELRRAMAAWKRKSSKLEALCRDLMAGLVANGYTPEFAQRLYDQIMGFGEYGFPESHSASFSLIVYVTAWLKRHHQAAFTAALINSQPMGFYAPAQLVRDAKDHGVEVREVDVNRSEWDCTLERRDDGALALRLGMRLVKGLSVLDAEAVSEAVKAHGAFTDVELLHRTSGARVAGLRKLAYADAFRSMGIDRQRALWEVRALRDPLPDEGTRDLWSDLEGEPSTSHLPEVSLVRHVQHDYASISLSLKAHPMSFVRRDLQRMGVVPAAALRDEERYPHGRPAKTAGIVLVRQRPGTANGIVFMTLEDETGIANLILRSDVFERYRNAARHATTVLAHGRVERAESVVHLVVRHLENLDEVAARVQQGSRNFH